jgi:hypothetical protein
MRVAVGIANFQPLSFNADHSTPIIQRRSFDGDGVRQPGFPLGGVKPGKRADFARRFWIREPISVFPCSSGPDRFICERATMEKFCPPRTGERHLTANPGE